MKECDLQPFKCIVCDNRFGRYSQLEAHFLAAHSGDSREVDRVKQESPPRAVHLTSIDTMHSEFTCDNSFTTCDLSIVKEDPDRLVIANV